MDTSIEHALCVLFTGGMVNHERIHSVKVEHLADGWAEAHLFNSQDQELTRFKFPPGWLQSQAIQEMLNYHESHM